MSEFIEFKRESSTGKTERWAINSKHHGDKLGTIKWHGAWRQYCFFPELDTLYSASCLRAIVDFIQFRMSLRKQLKAAEK